ncbi:ABC transporter ATP-binding protein/permease [Gammaproteobacteria bacterium]|nr:ABC transporter ATP-binding protein/permease [Gammaproteobacteria bacterium]MDA9175251.1 ABC transporter ATP-binding protein/permease [Gammaproteobacteria bacterium]MDA9834599.1 ABC transporter ATP-binding protein/permease [Gammaproteobacteria bacterium]MDA9979398.1 ABC transporter ATP-binding protein/permease [Gammaproteobacteria bacterium]MDC3371985.1 ABC transporter ATP-binding protein/permease [Gammaproteobacteria bacterium]
MNKLIKVLPSLGLWVHISRKEKIGLTFLVLLMLIAGLAEFISIGLIIPFIGFILNPETIFNLEIAQPIILALGLDHPDQLLLPITILLIISATLSSLIRITMLWFSTRLGYAISVDISSQIFYKTLCQPYEIHVNRHSSEVIAGITNKSKAIVNSNITPLLNILSSAIMIIGIITILLAINPLMTVFLFSIFAVIYILIALITRKAMARNGLIASIESNQVVRFLQEGLGNIRDVLISGTQKIYSDLFDISNKKLARATANIVITSGIPRFLIEGIAIIIVALGAYFFIDLNGNPSNIIPLAAAIVVSAQRLLPLLQLIFASVTSLRGGRAPLRDVLELINQSNPQDIADQSNAILDFNKQIIFKHISFKYKNSNSLILQDVNFEIPKGATIGFMGETGSGKSTIVDILMGLLKPFEGELLIDGNQITQANVNAWQSKISHVPQAIFINDSSIASNIAFGVPDNEIDLERVKHVAEVAQIHEAILVLEHGYNTVVGEMGAKLSGGQRQRIAIARALYRKFDVLVFDEATSALDTKTEKDLMNAINALTPKPTIVMIAHRISTLENCDVIYELNKGKILRYGDYNKMSSSNVDKDFD